MEIWLRLHWYPSLWNNLWINNFSLMQIVAPVFKGWMETFFSDKALPFYGYCGCLYTLLRYNSLHFWTDAILRGCLPLGQLKKNEHNNGHEAHSVAAPVISR